MLNPTERLATSKDTLDSKTLFEATFHNAFVGIAHVGLSGQWLRVNNRLLEMLGYDRPHLLSLTFQQITHPEDLDNDLHVLQQLNRGEIAHYSCEKRYLRKNGGVIWVNLQVATQHDAAGRIVHYIVSALDITATKRLEQQLRESVKDAEQFLNVLGHELRNPLNAIALTLELIKANAKQYPLPASATDGLASIQTNLKSMTNFLAYVDELATFQSGKVVLESVSLEVVIAEVLRLSEVTLSESGTQILLPSKLPDVLGQQTAVTHVLQNLIDNAVKYRRAEEPCVIQLTVAVEPDWIRLNVQDTGRGIPQDQMHQVFQAAWRATNVGNSPGRGFGLAFCQKIMNSLEGSISVESQEGVGTCFKLAFQPPRAR